MHIGRVLRSIGFAVLSVSLAVPRVVAEEPPPIQLIFDNHMDPMQAIPPAQRPTVYASWRDALQWLLAECNARGARISFSTVGEFMEYVQTDSSAWPLMQAVYANGGSLGTHSHQEHRVAAHTWQDLPPNPSPAQVLDAWNDHVGAVDATIGAIFGLSDPAGIRAINNIRGTHVPSSDAERIAMMQQFGFEVHQQGPCEVFYVFFRHYAMNPYRPDGGGNFLLHDADGPVVCSPFGPVLGKNEVHFGINQDMRLPALQTRFLITLLNWLDDVHRAQTGRVWVTGWGSHGSDIAPGGVSRPLVGTALDWHKSLFVDELVSGRQALQFSSAVQSAALYKSWEAAHPGDVSFSFPATETNWALYPYLMPAARYLVGATYVSTTKIGPIRLHRLTAPSANGGPYDLYVAYPNADAAAIVDLAATLGQPSILTVSPRSGLAPVSASSAVRVPPTGVLLVPVGKRLALPNGDVNLDGRVDFFDIDPFVAVLTGADTNPEHMIAADVDRSGVVNFFDIDPLVARLGQP